MQPSYLSKLFTLSDQGLWNSKAPCSHDSCIISSLRGVRNGIFYGGRVRFFHALVMTMLFKEGSIKEKLISIFKMTYEHSRNLGLFVLLYKTMCCVLNRLRGKTSKYHSLIAGGICGWQVFGDKTSVNQQIVLYLLSRNLTGAATNLQKKGNLPQMKFFPILATLCWAFVMFLFEDDKKTLQTSLTSSMVYLYKDSDQKPSSVLDFIPFTVPQFLKNALNIK